VRPCLRHMPVSVLEDRQLLNESPLATDDKWKMLTQDQQDVKSVCPKRGTPLAQVSHYVDTRSPREAFGNDITTRIKRHS
jgi:hypothetical protein